MNSLTTVKENLIKTLRQWDGLSHVQVEAAFSGRQQGLARPTLSVGIHQLTLEPAGFGGFFGHVGETSQQGVWAEVTLQIDCDVPDNRPTADVHLLFEQVGQCLLESPWNVQRLWCKEIQPVRTLHRNRLPVFVEIALPLAGEKSTGQITDVRLKRKEE